MKITRIDSEKNKNIKINNILDLEVDGNSYRLTNEFGELRVHLSDCMEKKLIIRPCTGNEILISTIKG